MNSQVYVAYHRWAPRIVGGPFVPVHVGRACARAPLPSMIGDDTGDNISDQNAKWCELTALYWAWKNDTNDGIVGLMHYRRVLDLLGEGDAGVVETHVPGFNVEDWTTSAAAWLDGDGQSYDIIVPRHHVMGRSVEENYKKSHAPQDWELARDIIAADHPAFLPDFDSIASGSRIRLGNLAIMKRDRFNRYCTLLFDILEQVAAKDVDRTFYSAYQGRYLGFLAERILTAFVEYERRTDPSVKIREVGILNLDRALVSPYLTDVDRPSEDFVNIAFSADRAYLPHAAAMLRSVMDHADPARPINLFFLHSDIPENDLQSLRLMLQERPLTYLHPMNTGTMFSKSYRSTSRAPSNSTYCRFLLFSLLPGLDRLLYLDGDIIVKTDVCKLYDTDIGTSQIAAVTDFVMTRTLTGPTPTVDPSVPDLGAYQRSCLGLSDAEMARYFNAGVLLFNFAAMEDPKAQGQSLMNEIDNKPYLFRDQDILNKAFKASLFQLDPRWNVFNSNDHVYGRVPQVLWEKAQAARKDPWIIHFADRTYKPWSDETVPLADHYWQALLRTPFFAEVLAGASARKIKPFSARVVGLGRAVATRLPFLKRPLLKIYYLLQGSR